MKKINSLSDLMMEELSDLLNAEKQFVEILPKMAQASLSPALKSALLELQKITQEHAVRLEDIFDNIGQKPSGRICRAMQGFIADIEDVVNDPSKYPARDNAMMKMVLRVENFEINGYATTRDHAGDLGHTKIVELLNASLNDERTMNFRLNELAQKMINTQAIVPDVSLEGKGFYVAEERFNKGGIKKKSKNTDVSRFISEGNPNLQEPKEKDDTKGQADL